MTERESHRTTRREMFRGCLRYLALAGVAATSAGLILRGAGSPGQGGCRPIALRAAAGHGGQETLREMTPMAKQDREIDRRRFLHGFLHDGVRLAGAAGLVGALGGRAVLRGEAEDCVWQIDPDKCIACDQCQTLCVLEPSAVKCVQCFTHCGYCDDCTGYFPTANHKLNSGAENHLCPTGAIQRTFIENQAGTRYFEYTIDELLCIGCGKCVKGCRLMNGSLYMQVRHDLCVGCNECAIAVGCPARAFRRVPASHPVLLSSEIREALRSRAGRLAEGATSQDSKQKSRQAELSLRETRQLLQQDARKIIDPGTEDG